MRRREVLTHREAQAIIERVQRRLEQEQRGAAVAVCDDHGELVCFVRTDGCPLPSVDVAINKAFTAARQQVESHELGELSRQRQFPVSNFGGLRYIGWGGGIPIKQHDAVVGAVGVSGLDEHEDVEFARYAVEGFTAKGPA